jgi:hypothetical protein
MKRKITTRILILVLSITLLAFVILSGSFYAYWNSAPPEKTCSSCHEIGKSVNMFVQSAHREFKCQECHGTALSNGFHSLIEKGMMVAHHVKSKIVEDIRLNEDQLLAVMNNCKRCHTSEYADWSSGGHSARYHDILLDRKQNEAEQINSDCLRCHGMFSDLPVQDLVEPLDKKGPWVLKIPEMADKPVIPCMTCHQTHRKGLPKVNPDYSDPGGIFYMRKDTSEVAGFYYRPERPVNVSDDILMRNCVMCHSPDARHQAGTSDDLTPRGVHEGLSCTACHESHSNDARKSCLKCHPAISNCKIDVTTMNTTYKDQKSPNNIHWVGCVDCHKEKNFRRN